MKWLRIITFFLFSIISMLHVFADVKKRFEFTDEHSKSFALIAKTWNSKGCDKDVPKKTKDAIEKACRAVRDEGGGVYKPKVSLVAGNMFVQCLLSSDAGFMEISYGTKEGEKFLTNQGFAEFKLDPKGGVFAIAQEGMAVGAAFCQEIEEEVSTRRSAMGYSTFQALFLNQYSPDTRMTADQFFGQIAKVNLCYKHHPGFVPYRCTKFFAKQKALSREIAAEHERKKRRKSKYKYY